MPPGCRLESIGQPNHRRDATGVRGHATPPFTEYAVRLGAEGVVITGCRESDCEFRLGDRWLQDRFAGTREPRLRAAAPRDRIAVV